MLKRISIVIDAELWGDENIMEQENAIIQGLMNARTNPFMYPIEFSDYKSPDQAKIIEKGDKIKLLVGYDGKVYDDYATVINVTDGIVQVTYNDIIWNFTKDEKLIVIKQSANQKVPLPKPQGD